MTGGDVSSVAVPEAQMVALLQVRILEGLARVFQGHEVRLHADNDCECVVVLLMNALVAQRSVKEYHRPGRRV